MNKLIVLSGVPGSGKSYFSALLRLQKKTHVYVISSDGLRREILGNQRNLSEDELIWRIFYALTKAFSEDKNGIVILDATNAKKEYRLNNIKPFKNLYDQQKQQFLKAEQAQLHVKEKAMENEKLKLEQQLKMMEAELQTLDQSINNGIKDSAPQYA